LHKHTAKRTRIVIADPIGYLIKADFCRLEEPLGALDTSGAAVQKAAGEA